jgi:NitT/TauT family transport system substrate-binding protein
MPVQLARAIGADKAEGLDLKLRFFSGGPLAIRDLSDNNSDFSVVGLPAIASSRADQIPVLAIGQLSQSAMVTLMLRRDLKSKISTIAQLKGKRIGVNTSTRTARSTSQMLAEYLIKRAGLSIDDVQIIPAGQSKDAQRAALLSDTVDAVMGDEPFATELQNSGEVTILSNLYDPKKSHDLLGGPFVHAALATREDVYALHPQTVLRVQRMMDRSLLWISQHTPQEVMTALADQPGFTTGNPALLTSVLKANAGMYPRSCTWDLQAIETTEKFFRGMAETPKERNLHFSEFIRYAPQ